MKFWTKIIVTVLTLAMILSMAAACKKNKDDTNTETTPAGAATTNAPSSTAKPDESTPIIEDDEDEDEDEDDDEDDDDDEGELTDRAESKDINEALDGFITGDLAAEYINGKQAAINGDLGQKYWTGTTEEGYAIMTDNYNEDESMAVITFPISVLDYSILQFDVWVDTAQGDVFYVLLDNVKYSALGDCENGKYKASIFLEEGDHEVSLVYKKDIADSYYTDTVYVSKATVTTLSTTIDGVKDEFYTGATFKMVKNPSTSTPEGWQGGGMAYITNDDLGLYIYVEVTDSCVVDNSNNTVDDEDKVQIYLDYGRTFEELELEGQDYKNEEGTRGAMKLGWVNVNPDGSYGANYGFRHAKAEGNDVTIPGVKAAAVKTANGYAVEVFIPFAWGVIGENETIGLGIQIGDDNNDNDKDPNATFYSEPASQATFWYRDYNKLPEYTIVK